MALSTMTCVTKSFQSLCQLAPNSIAFNMRNRRARCVSVLGKKKNCRPLKTRCFSGASPIVLARFRFPSVLGMAGAGGKGPVTVCRDLRGGMPLFVADTAEVVRRSEGPDRRVRVLSDADRGMNFGAVAESVSSLPTVPVLRSLESCSIGRELREWNFFIEELRPWSGASSSLSTTPKLL